MMKHFILMAIALTSLHAFAGTSDFKLVQSIKGIKKNPCENCKGAKYGAIYLKNQNEKIELANSDQDESLPFLNLKLEDNILYLNVDNASRMLPIATFEENNIDEANRILNLPYPENKRENISPELLTSKENIKVSIIVNEKVTKLKAMLCVPCTSQCIPFPHLETEVRQLLEIKTLDGESVCYNRNVLTNKKTISSGACLKN